MHWGYSLVPRVFFGVAIYICSSAPRDLCAQSLLADSFSATGTKLDTGKWTTETGPASFLGRTQLADWVTPSGVGQFVVGNDGAHLTLSTYNPTGASLYGTHAKSVQLFQPTNNTAIVLTASMRLHSLQPGIVYAVYFYGCSSASVCETQHDEIDIELVTNTLQPGAPLTVQLNRYANELLGGGNGQMVALPAGFDPLVSHDWAIRWSLTQVDYFLDGALLLSSKTHIPQGPMQANVIAWAPDAQWPQAYSLALQPVSSAAQNQSFSANLTSVRVESAPLSQSPVRLSGTFVLFDKPVASPLSGTYGEDFRVGDSWNISLASGESGADFAICSTKDYGSAVCAPHFGQTDQNGNWELSGTFGPEAVGQWTEWLVYSSGAMSNRISFSVGKNIAGQLTIQKDRGGVFTAGQSWTLSVAGAPGGSPFDICSEWNGVFQGCAHNFGMTGQNGSWTLSGVFPFSTLGAWTEWLRFATGESSRIAFSVVEPQDPMCASGALRPAGSQAGYAGFKRYQPDWKPADTRDYLLNGDRVGGVGNTLEYHGCGGANFVWLDWEFGGFGGIAVRAPWMGETDQGLHIGDTAGRFHALYPAAQHPTEPFPDYYHWPQDFDVWDVGPLRVVLQSGRVSIIAVDWTFVLPGNPDQQESTRTVIGPADWLFRWY